jgi:CubicO group peptidase (beta-lactamase class C family)
MRPSRRDYLWGLASFVAAGASARGEQVNPYTGTWSVSTTDEQGVTQRLKIVITADRKASLVIVDEANISIPASLVELASPDVNIEWKSVGVAFKGVLKNDTIEGTISSATAGESQAITFVRGDLFAVNIPVLPPGVMDQKRLQQLRIIAEAPAMGVAWAFASGKDRVLVDGLRAADAKTQVALADQWHIGSCTKSMTATLAARLVEAGHIKWEATVGQILGPHLPPFNAAYKDATLLQLLAHHSGLPHDVTGTDKYGRGLRPDIRAERLQYLAAVLNEAPVVTPGKEDSYSNAGYVAAGAMLELVMDKPWEELMRAHVFAPLGLTSAGFGPPGHPDKYDQPVGHASGAGGKVRPATKLEEADYPPPVTGPCGTVHLNLRDLLAYLKAHRDRAASFLSEASWKTLHTAPFGGNYALGWGGKEDGTLSHSGSNGLWWANVVITPEGLAFAATMNAVTPGTTAVMTQALDAAGRSRE